MTRLQKRILATIGFTAMVLLGLSLFTVGPFVLMTFFYKNKAYLDLSIIDSVVIPTTFVAVTFTLGLLRRS
jgi:hypothetical protein